MQLLPQARDDTNAPYPPPTTKSLIESIKSQDNHSQHAKKLLKSIDKLAIIRFHPIATPIRIVFVIVVLLLIFTIPNAAPSGAQGLLFLSIIVGGSTLLGRINKHLARHTHSSARAASLVAQGHCGRCAYPLQGLEPHTPNQSNSNDSANAIINCPECGSNWYKDRIATPFWNSSDAYKPPKPSIITSFFFQRTGATSPQAEDHRHKWSHYADSFLRSVPREHQQQIPKHQRKQFTRRTRRATTPFRILLALVAAIIPAILAYAIMQMSNSASLSTTARFYNIAAVAFFAVITALVSLSVLLSDRAIPKRTIAKHLLMIDRCPTCAADLSNATKNADGTCTCNTCQSAWKRTHPSSQLTNTGDDETLQASPEEQDRQPQA